MKKVAIIGSGFSGLSAACYLSKMGYKVEVFEKNEQVGGRARQLKTEEGYTFDMGPSWYWMPDVFDRFFADFNYKVSDFYTLKLLEPSFEVVFAEFKTIQIPSKFQDLKALFESIEKGSAARLEEFMKEAEYKYQVGINKLVYKPGLQISEFFDLDIFKGVFRLQLLSSFSKHVRKYFSHPQLIALMEFPVLFLGAMPKDTPALYSLMNYAGLKLGTWYPDGGFGKVIDAMVEIAKENKVQFQLNSAIEKINVANGVAKSLTIKGVNLEFDAIIGSADYHHIESKLLEKEYRNYSEEYWNKKVFAPSCLIYYLGFSKSIPNLNHHTLFFDEDLDQHAIEIYKEPKWPTKPLFYVCCPSKTDKNIAPKGHENVFLLMPLAPGIEDNYELRTKYFDIMMTRLEAKVGMEIRSSIDFQKSYCVNDFVLDYNSFKGNAYGLANTLSQTANLKPKMINKKVKNLFYTGQLTVPGPGVPPSIISGNVVSKLVDKYLNS